MIRPAQRCRPLCFSVLLLIVVTSVTAAQNRVRAKIGIQIKSNGHSVRAQAEHTIHAGDRLRIYIIPGEDVYIYAVHEDEERITLLNDGEHRNVVKKGFIIVLPHYDRYYRIDGQSKIESFSIILSPSEILELSELFSSKTVSHDKWASIKNRLIGKSQINLTDTPPKPFEIAGDVRGITSEPFFKKLQIFSGNGLLLKQYAFKLKN